MQPTYLMKGDEIMNKEIFEKFYNLSPEDKNKLIALMIKLLTYYQPVFSAHQKADDIR
jgi:hypothetical protein